MTYIISFTKVKSKHSSESPTYDQSKNISFEFYEAKTQINNNPSIEGLLFIVNYLTNSTTLANTSGWLIAIFESTLRLRATRRVYIECMRVE